jgi:hypothetical protein
MMSDKETAFSVPEELGEQRVMVARRKGRGSGMALVGVQAQLASWGNNE